MALCFARCVRLWAPGRGLRAEEKTRLFSGDAARGGRVRRLRTGDCDREGQKG